MYDHNKQKSHLFLPFLSKFLNMSAISSKERNPSGVVFRFASAILKILAAFGSSGITGRPGLPRTLKNTHSSEVCNCN